jgi:hypothetical protein
MSEAEFDFYLARMFFAYAGAIVFFLLLLVGRRIRLLLFGHRERGKVVRVSRQEPGPSALISEGNVGGGAMRGSFQYYVAVTNPAGRREVVLDPGGLPFQEFRVGDMVAIFVLRGRRLSGEITTWTRGVVAFLVIALVLLGLFIGHQVLLGKRSPPPPASIVGPQPP